MFSSVTIVVTRGLVLIMPQGQRPGSQVMTPVPPSGEAASGSSLGVPPAARVHADTDAPDIKKRIDVSGAN